MDRKGRDKLGKNPWQYAQHVWPCTDLLLALKGECLSSVFSPDGTLISSSAAPHCGVLSQGVRHVSDYIEVRLRFQSRNEHNIANLKKAEIIKYKKYTIFIDVQLTKHIVSPSRRKKCLARRCSETMFSKNQFQQISVSLQMRLCSATCFYENDSLHEM